MYRWLCGMIFIQSNLFYSPKSQWWACTSLMLRVIPDLVQGLWKLELSLWLSESPAVEIINTEQEFTLGTQWEKCTELMALSERRSNKISFVYKTYFIKVSALLHADSLKAISSIFKQSCKSRVWWCRNIWTARTFRLFAMSFLEWKLPPFNLILS